MKYLLIGVLLSFSQLLLAQEDGKEKDKKDTKIKTYVSFYGNKSFLQNEAKYFNFSFGLKAKCKYKIGFGYSWLRGNFKTEEYPVNTTDYPDALAQTRTDAKFYSVSFEPILLTEKKINISTPVHIGVSEVISDYQVGTLNYNNYYQGNPVFASVGVDFDFRLLGFMKLGFNLGYRYVLSDLELAQETFSTPLMGFGIKIGGMCK